MPCSFSEAIIKISQITGGMISEFEVQHPECFAIRHSFKPTIIVPYMAIKNNVAFLTTSGNKKVITSDKVICNATNIQEKHICDLESDISTIYNLTAWDFIKRWRANEVPLGSMYFIKMDLSK